MQKPSRYQHLLSQGFNAGVVLYHLAKMRRSKAYISASGEGMASLAQKYRVVEFIGGDQDWLTLLVHLLPCQYNRQVQALVNHHLSCFPSDQQQCRHRPSVLLATYLIRICDRTTVGRLHYIKQAGAELCQAVSVYVCVSFVTV